MFTSENRILLAFIIANEHEAHFVCLISDELFTNS